MAKNQPEIKNDPPPIFREWWQLYTFVLLCHALIIGLFYWLTRIYS